MKKLIGILIAVIILLSGVVVYLVVTKDNNVSENPGGNNQEVNENQDENKQEQQIDYTSYVPEGSTYIKTITTDVELNGKHKITEVLYYTKGKKTGDDSIPFFIKAVIFYDNKIIEEEATIDVIVLYDFELDTLEEEIATYLNHHKLSMEKIKDSKNNDQYLAINVESPEYGGVTGYTTLLKEDGTVLAKLTNTLTSPGTIEIKDNLILINRGSSGYVKISIENGYLHPVIKGSCEISAGATC